MFKCFKLSDQLEFQFKKPRGVFISLSHLMREACLMVKNARPDIAGCSGFTLSEALKITWNQFHYAVSRWQKGQDFDFPAYTFEVV